MRGRSTACKTRKQLTGYVGISGRLEFGTPCRRWHHQLATLSLEARIDLPVLSPAGTVGIQDANLSAGATSISLAGRTKIACHNDTLDRASPTWLWACHRTAGILEAKVPRYVLTLHEFAVG